MGLEWPFACLKRTALTQLTQSIVAHQLSDDLGLQGVFAGFEWVAGAQGGQFFLDANKAGRRGHAHDGHVAAGGDDGLLEVAAV